MTALSVDFLIVLFAAVCLHRINWAGSEEQAVHRDYLSAESGKYIRGLLSMIVVFHHLARPAEGVVLLPILGKVGYLAVAVFFFMSGYGLMVQYTGKPCYGKGFLLRRLPTILIPYLLATVLYGVVYRILGEPWSVKAVWMGFVNGTPIVTASWYIICIFLFYIAFKVLMGLCGTKHTCMILGAMIYCGVYTGFCISMDYGSWWYNTVIVLVFGMAWALSEEKILGKSSSNSCAFCKHLCSENTA